MCRHRTGLSLKLVAGFFSLLIHRSVLNVLRKTLLWKWLETGWVKKQEEKRKLLLETPSKIPVMNSDTMETKYKEMYKENMLNSQFSYIDYSVCKQKDAIVTVQGAACWS